MAKIPARQFVEKLAEKVNARTDIIKNFVQQLSDEGKLTRTKIKNRWHFDDDDLYSAYTEWLFSNQFISSIEIELNSLPNNSWEKIRLLLLKISEFNFVPLCQPYGREFSIGTINKENHDLAKFLLDLITRLENHLLEGYSDTYLQFRPPSWYQGYCRAFGTLTAHLGGCYTSTHDLNKFCYTQNALAEFINGRFTSKAVDFDIFLRHFGLNVEDFTLPINEDKDKFFDDRPPITTFARDAAQIPNAEEIDGFDDTAFALLPTAEELTEVDDMPNATVSVPAPVQASIGTSHDTDTEGKKIMLANADASTTNINLEGEFNMENNTMQQPIINFGDYFAFLQFAEYVSHGQTRYESALMDAAREILNADATQFIQQLTADKFANPERLARAFLEQCNTHVICAGKLQKVISGNQNVSLKVVGDYTGDKLPCRLHYLPKEEEPATVDTGKFISCYDAAAANDVADTSPAVDMSATTEPSPKNSKSSPKKSTTKNSTKKEKPKDKPTVVDSSTPTEQTAPMSNNILRTRDFIADCPANLNIPNDFSFSNNGILYEAPAKKEGGKKRLVCVANLPIVPTKAFREVGTNITTYEVAIKKRNKWWRTTVDGRTLQDPRRVLDLANDSASIEEPKLLAKFFARTLIDDNLPEIQIYSQTGWANDEFTNFVYIGNEDCIIRRGDFKFDRDLATRGDAELWKQKFIEVAERGGVIAHAYIGIALAAILARPLNLMNPQAHLFGTSGSGKTALQKFTASIFGNPRHLKRNFASTKKNRQLVAAAFCDLPTFIDELGTIQSKKDEETLANDVYNFADGKGNQANKRDGTARETFEFGGARLTTGERTILKQNDPQGAFKRLLQFGTNDPIFDDEFATDLHIFSESNFGHFAKPWIQFAIAHMAEIQAKYQHYAKKDPSTQNYEPTHLKMLAIALVAFEFFKVMLGINAEFDAIELIRDRRYLIDYQLPTLDQMNDATRAIEFFKSVVAGNDKSFAHEVNKPDFDNEFAQSTNECYGKIFKNGEVAILPHIFKELLEKRGGFDSADRLRLDFYNKGLLRHTEGTMTFPTWFNGKTQKMIRFKAGVLSSPETEENSSAQAD